MRAQYYPIRIDNMDCTKHHPPDRKCICELPEPTCSRCGINQSDTEEDYLVDCTIIIAEDEEGFAHITQLWCFDCLEKMQKPLTDLGFKDHRHGSINFLEDRDCPGAHNMKDCPAPCEYGNYVVR